MGAAQIASITSVSSAQLLRVPVSARAWRLFTVYPLYYIKLAIRANVRAPSKLSACAPWRMYAVR